MKAYRVNAQKRLRLSAPFRGAVVFMFALAANLAAQVTTIYIDAYDQPAATGWNQIRLSSAGTYSNLVDSTGADIPVWMQVTTAISGPNANSANPPTGDAAEFAPAGQNQCFGSTTPSVSVVRGLDPDCVYTFTFYGSRVGVTDNRDTRFLVEGATAGLFRPAPTPSSSTAMCRRWRGITWASSPTVSSPTRRPTSAMPRPATTA